VLFEFLDPEHRGLSRGHHDRQRTVTSALPGHPSTSRHRTHCRHSHPGATVDVPRELDRQTGPVGHRTQLPTHRAPSRTLKQLGEHLAGERVPLHPGR